MQSISLFENDHLVTVGYVCTIQEQTYIVYSVDTVRFELTVVDIDTRESKMFTYEQLPQSFEFIVCTKHVRVSRRP